MKSRLELARFRWRRGKSDSHGSFLELIEAIAPLYQLEHNRDEEELLKLEGDLILGTEEQRNCCRESSADDNDVVDVPVVLREYYPSEPGDANHDIDSVKDRQGEVDPISSSICCDRCCSFGHEDDDVEDVETGESSRPPSVLVRSSIETPRSPA